MTLSHKYVESKEYLQMATIKVQDSFQFHVYAGRNEGRQRKR